jgi:hypothetical protein
VILLCSVVLFCAGAVLLLAANMLAYERIVEVRIPPLVTPLPEIMAWVRSPERSLVHQPLGALYVYLRHRREFA